MTVWFVVALMLRRNDVADIAWGIGFMLVALYTFVAHSPAFDRSFVVTLLVLIWGTRLSTHIYRRNHDKPEDKRYAAWRQAWGRWFILRSYLQVFMLQGLLLGLISVPVIITNTQRGPLAFTVFDVVGLLVWIIGFLFEHQGDRQLRDFLRDPANKGKVLSTGLWRYTRHPNYFGEVTMWWGIWIISLSIAGAFVGIIGPLTITVLILFVSGVPMLEKGMAANPIYDDYRRKTSIFVPWWVKG